MVSKLVKMRGITTIMELKTVCPCCMRMHIVKVAFDDFVAWKNGKLIQKAMPYLEDYEREMLISGVCRRCWDDMFTAGDE